MGYMYKKHIRGGEDVARGSKNLSLRPYGRHARDPGRNLHRGSTGPPNCLERADTPCIQVAICGYLLPTFAYLQLKLLIPLLEFKSDAAIYFKSPISVKR